MARTQNQVLGLIENQVTHPESCGFEPLPRGAILPSVPIPLILIVRNTPEELGVRLEGVCNVLVLYHY